MVLQVWSALRCTALFSTFFITLLVTYSYYQLLYQEPISAFHDLDSVYDSAVDSVECVSCLGAALSKQCVC
jgi:hypothetical protein